MALIFCLLLVSPAAATEQVNGIFNLNFAQESGWGKSSPSGEMTIHPNYNIKESRNLLTLRARGGDCWVDLNKTVNLTGKNLILDLYVADTDKLPEIHVLLDTSDNWSSYFGYTIHSSAIKKGWNSISLVPGVFYPLGANPPEYSKLAKIKRWRFKVAPTTGQEAAVSFKSLRSVDLPTRGKATLTFDDGFRSVYLEAKPRMDKYNFKGVAFVITDLVGKDKRMNLKQLTTLQTSGWDISSHTKTHKYLTEKSVTLEEIKKELMNSQKWLRDFGFNKGARFFASPGGQFNEAVVNEIKKHYQVHRTIMEEKELFPPADPYCLKIRNIVNTTKITDVKRWIDEAAVNKEWLILVFHSIEEPAATSITVSPSAFQEILNLLVQSNLEVLTMSQVFR